MGGRKGGCLATQVGKGKRIARFIKNRPFFRFNRRFTGFEEGLMQKRFNGVNRTGLVFDRRLNRLSDPVFKTLIFFYNNK